MMLIFFFFLLILFLIFWHWPAWGLYVVVFLAPFLGLTLDFSRFEWAQGIGFLKNLDGPAADFAVLILFLVVVFRIMVKRPLPTLSYSGGGHNSSPARRGRVGSFGTKIKKLFFGFFSGIGLFYFLPFLISGLFSLFNVSYDQFGASLKYFFRPILFFYLMWVLLPVILIDSERVLNCVIKILFWTGLAAAVMGLISLFVNPPIFGFWHRAAPLEFFGLAPLAFNHNLLAEVLVAVAPLGFYLFVRLSLRAKRSNPEQQWDRHAPTVVGARDDIKKIYFFGFILITIIALLTFARAAWLALAAQVIIYYLVLVKRSHLVCCHSRPVSRYGVNSSGNPENTNLTGFPVKQGMTNFWLAIIIIPLFIYLLLFSASPIVRSSNATRLDLSGIAWTYFQLHPWLGNGVGTFVPLVEQTRLFTIEYGDPLDAHGIVQKLLAEQGLLGLITFSIFVGWILFRLWQGIKLAEEKSRLLLLCLFLSVIGSLVYQLFNTSYYNAHLWLPVGVGLAAVKVKGSGYRV